MLLGANASACRELRATLWEEKLRLGATILALDKLGTRKSPPEGATGGFGQVDPFRLNCTTEPIRGGANLWHVKELLGDEHLDTLQPHAKLTITDLKKTHAKCHPRERES